MLRAAALALASSAALARAASVTLNTTTIPHLGWVRATVTLAAPATAGFFLTVHTPAAANVTPIPPQPYPAEAPWLAAAAQKWVACASIVGCLGSTSFSFDFSCDLAVLRSSLWPMRCMADLSQDYYNTLAIRGRKLLTICI
jgi:hypothetical protein